MKNTLFIPEQKTPHFYLPSHTVTWDQDYSHLKKGFSKEDFNYFLELYSRAENSPKKVIKEVVAFQKMHPDHPEILNLLTFLCTRLKKVRRASELIDENFQKNPSYLFARINYADLSLQRKKPEKIPGLFNNKFNLRDFCPNKKMFHVSLFRGFMVMMGHYHLMIGKREAAECYHYLARHVAPTHPGTKVLQKKLYYKPIYKRLILKLSRS